MKYIDIHTHRLPEKEQGNVVRFLNLIVGQSHASDYPSHLPFSAGIHPWYIEGDGRAQLEALWEVARQPEVWMIGEAGLDKTRPDLPFQQTLFEPWREVLGGTDGNSSPPASYVGLDHSWFPREKHASAATPAGGFLPLVWRNVPRRFAPSRLSAPFLSRNGRIHAFRPHALPPRLQGPLLASCGSGETGGDELGKHHFLLI